MSSKTTDNSSVCKICGSPGKLFGKSRIMAKYDAEYIQCIQCKFMYAKNPVWLVEAYSSAMTSTDMGHVFRTDQNSLRTKAVVDCFYDSANRFLDYGSGYGLLVRRMRDLGYNFFGYDRYCNDLFAPQFHLEDISTERFDLITSYEVFEHLENPMEVFDLLLAHGDNLLFCTEILKDPAPPLQDWWYYAPEHGQHISFYSMESLVFAAGQHGRYLYSNGNDFHLFSRKKLNDFWFQKVIVPRNSQWLGLRRKRKTLLSDDFQNQRKQVLNKLAGQEKT